MKNNTYILLIEVSKNLKISAGSLNKIDFKRGFYIYTGSARKNLQKRIERHLRKKKKKFWHIDYLLSHKSANIKEVWFTYEYTECDIADFFLNGNFDFIKKFGSSDCNCESHLFYADKNLKKVKNLIKNKASFRIL